MLSTVDQGARSSWAAPIRVRPVSSDHALPWASMPDRFRGWATADRRCPATRSSGGPDATGTASASPPARQWPKGRPDRAVGIVCGEQAARTEPPSPATLQRADPRAVGSRRDPGLPASGLRHGVRAGCCGGMGCCSGWRRDHGAPGAGCGRRPIRPWTAHADLRPRGRCQGTGRAGRGAPQRGRGHRLRCAPCPAGCGGARPRVPGGLRRARRR